MRLLDKLKSILSPSVSEAEPMQPVLPADTFDASPYSTFHQPEFKP